NRSRAVREERTDAVRRDRRVDETKDEVTQSRSARGLHSSGQARAVTLAIVVAAITFVAFLPALGADFVSWDDERNFLTNPHYRGLGLEQLRWMWTTTLLGHYVPLTWMTLGADYLLWGMRPSGYHLTNLVFHTANAAMVFAVARAVFKRVARPGDGTTSVDAAAAVSALLFAVHPLRVESVAWITERRDVVSMFFCLLTIL